MKIKCINNKDFANRLTVGKVYDAERTPFGYYVVDDTETAKLFFSENRFEVVRNVEHPQHYNQGIECWDYTTSHDMNFLQGNIIKYVTRYRHKNGIEDLKKALQYLNKLIEVESNK